MSPGLRNFFSNWFLFRQKSRQRIVKDVEGVGFHL